MADEQAPKLAPRPGSRGRRFITTGLLFATYVLGLAAVCSQIPIFLAASRVINADTGSSGPSRLLLPDFAIASFDGIIPDDDGQSYLVTMRMSLTSFGWEFPSAPNKTQSAGLVSPTNDNSLYLPRDFVPIGKALGLDPSAWACFPPAWAETCENPFFAAFRNQWPFDSPPGLLSRLIFTLSFVVAGTIFLIELLIAVRPHWLKCRCYFSVLKRFCPCPRGERRDIERLPPSFWDRYRLWMWPLLPCYVGLGALDLSARGWLLLSWLDRTADGGAAAMRPRMGKGFVAANWVGVACALAATVCVLVRSLLSRRVNWMEQQGAGPIVEAATSVGLDDGPATVDEGRPQGYTDAPDAPIAPKVPDPAVK